MVSVFLGFPPLPQFAASFKGGSLARMYAWYLAQERSFVLVPGMHFEVLTEYFQTISPFGRG